MVLLPFFLRFEECKDFWLWKIGWKTTNFSFSCTCFLVELFRTEHTKNRTFFMKTVIK